MSFLVHARAETVALPNDIADAFRILVVTAPAVDSPGSRAKALYLSTLLPGETSKFIAGLRDLANKLEAQTWDEE